MTQSKHTPGPWEVRYFGLKKDQIAVVSTVPITDEYEGGEYEPIIADLYRGGSGYAPDARLIAESPTMHDLLLKLQAVRSPRELHNLRCEVAEVLARIEGAN